MIKPSLDVMFLCSENARCRIKDVANILKKSPQRIKYSLKVLDQEGILQYPHAIFDYSYLGLVLFRVYFKGGYINAEEKARIIAQLNQNPYVVTMYEMGSGFDLVLEMIAPNPSRFNKEVKKIAGLAANLNNYTPVLNVVTHIYPRYYLTTGTYDVSQEIIIGGDREVVSFSENELALMKSLLAFPKHRYSSLAKASNINIKTMHSLFKSLKQKKVLKGFKYVVNTGKLGIRKFRLFLKLHNISTEREDKLVDYCLRTDEILQLNKTIGDWDIEIDIGSFDEARIRQLTLEIRENFKDLIQNFNIIEFYQYYKKSYLPLYMWQPEQKI